MRIVDSDRIDVRGEGTLGSRLDVEKRDAEAIVRVIGIDGKISLPREEGIEKLKIEVSDGIINGGIPSVKVLSVSMRGGDASLWMEKA